MTRLPGALVAGLVLLCAGGAKAWLQQPSTDPSAPDIQETNRRVDIGNRYSILLTTALVWKEPQSAECQGLKLHMATMAAEQQFVPEETPGLTELGRLEIQQRAEENNLTRLAVLSDLVHRALFMECLALPPAKLSPPRGPSSPVPNAARRAGEP